MFSQVPECRIIKQFKKDQNGLNRHTTQFAISEIFLIQPRQKVIRAIVRLLRRRLERGSQCVCVRVFSLRVVFMSYTLSKVTIL